VDVCLNCNFFDENNAQYQALKLALPGSTFAEIDDFE
jgi:hypothetical protein